MSREGSAIEEVNLQGKTVKELFSKLSLTRNQFISFAETAISCKHERAAKSVVIDFIILLVRNER